MAGVVEYLAVVLLVSAVVLADRPSAADRTYIQDRHNWCRANPHPPSDGPINPITYQATTSNGLPSMEDVASSYATTCSLAHNNNRGVGFPAGYYVGENIAAWAWSGSSPSNTTQGFFGQSMDFWYGEYPNFYFDSNGRGQCVSGTTCGHYTQVTWNNTLNVGCGFSYCNGGPISGNWIFLVCDYLQAGNFNGYDAYRQGTGAASPSPSPTRSRTSSPSRPAASPSSSSSKSVVPPSASSSKSPVSASPSSSPTRPAASASSSVSKSPAASASASVSKSVAASPSASVSKSAAASASASSSKSIGSSASSSKSAASASASVSKSAAASASKSSAASASASPSKPAVSASSSPSKSQVSASASATKPASASSSASKSPVSASPSPTRSRSKSPLPCGGSCGANAQCVSNQCQCLAGYTLTNGVCQANSVPAVLDFSRDFQTVYGPSSNGWTIPDTALNVAATGEQTIEWTAVRSVVDAYNTKVNIDVRITGGNFGVGFRQGQTRSGVYYPNDMFLVSYENIGTANEAVYARVMTGTQLTVWGPFTFMPKLQTAAGSVNHLTFTLTKNDAAATIEIHLEDGSGYNFVAAVNADAFPSVGGVAFHFVNPLGLYPAISNSQLATTTTLEVSLTQCIDVATWTQLFYQATGANPATTSVQARASGENGNCAKAAKAGEEVASALTVVVSSTTVSSKAIASSFVAAVESGSPAVAGLAVESAAVLPGTAGAIAAGVPVGATTVPAFTVGGAAAGGGAAGGLSGGAIAGIVVGSVAGAVLVLGVVSLVVVAVIVAAVIVAKKASSSEPVEERVDAEAPVEHRAGLRHTVYNLFRGPRGGVDVMGNNPNGHQSITARAPPMK